MRVLGVQGCFPTLFAVDIASNLPLCPLVWRSNPISSSSDTTIHAVWRGREPLVVTAAKGGEENLTNMFPTFYQHLPCRLSTININNCPDPNQLIHTSLLACFFAVLHVIRFVDRATCTRTAVLLPFWERCSPLCAFVCKVLHVQGCGRAT